MKSEMYNENTDRDHVTKSAWPSVTFGDMVANVNQTERNPLSVGLERYVGLEHIEPENLHIKSWGDVAEGTSFTKVFREGQTLFGKRRAYQRKVAYAEFDGICSGDILVFESKDPKVLLPELLPFICQTERFFQHALDTSAGSLSPRTSWTALAKYEFPLPPIEEQRRITEILWAADEAVERWREAGKEIILLLDEFRTRFMVAGWPQAILGDLLKDIQYGSSKPIVQEPGNNVPVLRIPNIAEGVISLQNIGYTQVSKEETRKYELKKGDILIVRTNGNPDYVGRTAVVDVIPDNCIYASYLIRLRCDEKKLVPSYLHNVLQTHLVRTTLRHEIRSSAGNYNLNSNGIRKQRVPLPPIDKQLEIVTESQILIEKQNDLNRHINVACDLFRNLINNKELLSVFNESTTIEQPTRSVKDKV